MANNGKYLTGYELARNHGFYGTEDEWFELMVKGWSELADHVKLRNKTAPDQHPITSISGLNEELTAIKSRLADLEDKA